jgi:hypothetical protein
MLHFERAPTFKKITTRQCSRNGLRLGGERRGEEAAAQDAKEGSTIHSPRPSHAEVG